MDIKGNLNVRTLFTYKNLFGLFSRKAEIWQTWKVSILHFELQYQVVEVTP